MSGTSWVSADGGAMDRVVVLCAVLLGLCAAVMVGVTIARDVWGGVAFWTVVLALCLVVGRQGLRRVRRAGREDPS
ncbi:hypothetical protein ACHAAC_01750 [Aeromicrobium sp. CF4.19]|uniref:hypothetical protein n=1 Tax=Aeromicrobium sp. CF4.19 TaxID=3373082 RepID=UPI003EE65AED